MALRGGFELMTELADLLVQVSHGSSVLGKLSHERRSSRLLGGESGTEEVIVGCVRLAPTSKSIPIYTLSSIIHRGQRGVYPLVDFMSKLESTLSR